MNGKTTLAVSLATVFILAALAAYLHHAGVTRGREEAQSAYADSSAAQAGRTADSVRTANALHVHADSVSAQAARDTATARLNAAKRETNAAIEQGAKAVRNAEQILADSGATISELRNQVTLDTVAIQRLTERFEAERTQAREQHLTDSSSYATSLATVKQGYAAERAADSTRAAKREAGWHTTLALATDKAERRGEIKGVAAVTTAAAALVALVHFAR